MKPWREIAVPHPDVLRGTFQQAEFAADLSAVRAGKAPPVYQDAAAFFARTYITEGMRLLLTQVAKRLAGRDGGEPVIQLQTAFGGGKTHTMLAVWHLATRTCPLSDLPGLPLLVEQAGLLDLPTARVAVLDGTAHSPGQPWKAGRLTVRTLWGELAAQLGGAEAFALVREADATGTSPGKEVLRQVLAQAAPCVVLLDELVAYIGQFEDGQALSGGTFESNLAFMQALTEAAKLVPNALVLASLPESELEVGSARGVRALKALEKRFGRVQALWKPVLTEEAFEIVRRRLFEPIRDEAARQEVCRAFADAYVAVGAGLPAETQEANYLARLSRAYPIHPELFDRLYEDWTTIDGFQRTRGVLKLMAKVISRLWRASNADLMIMPGSLPLGDADVRNELTYLLPPGWDPVIEGDIDGDRSEAAELEGREPRFGQVQAARRVTRTLFLGSAPSSVATRPGLRGLDRGRVLLGCLQPGQPAAVFADALGRLADRLHYLNASGDKAAETTRFWFDTRANLRREMEERKRRFDPATDLRRRIGETLRRLLGGSALWDGVHVFTPPADVPDDGALRLVVLPLEQAHHPEAGTAAEAVLTCLASHGTQPRHRANRLLFLAADHAIAGRLLEATRVALAWESIVADVEEGRLNIDQAQRAQAQKEARAAADVLPRAARECYKWLLCPTQDDPGARLPSVEAFPVPATTGTAAAELDRVCRENELVIEAWSPIHLRAVLRDYYWKPDRPAVAAKVCWEDSQRYLYLPRLRSREVLAAAVRAGTASRDFFGTALGCEGGKLEGFQFGVPVAFDDGLWLVEPAEATRRAAAQQAAAAAEATAALGVAEAGPGPSGTGSLVASPAAAGAGAAATAGGGVGGVRAAPARSFRGVAEVPAALAKSRLNTLAEEVIALLASDPYATVRVTVEIDAAFPQGVTDALRRSVSENATSLGLKTRDWEA